MLFTPFYAHMPFYAYIYWHGAGYVPTLPLRGRENSVTSTLPLDSDIPLVLTQPKGQ